MSTIQAHATEKKSVGRPRKNTQMADETKTNVEKIKVQISSLDGNLDDVTAVKTIEFTAAENEDDAKNRAGEKYLYALNLGLRQLEMEKAKNSTEGFFVVSDDGTVSDVPFSGNVLSDDQVKRVQVQVLTFAKMASEMAGETWDKSLSAEKKRAYKDSAKEAMKESPAIMKMISGQVKTS